MTHHCKTCGKNLTFWQTFVNRDEEGTRLCEECLQKWKADYESKIGTDDELTVRDRTKKDIIFSAVVIVFMIALLIGSILMESVDIYMLIPVAVGTVWLLQVFFCYIWGCWMGVGYTRTKPVGLDRKGPWMSLVVYALVTIALVAYYLLQKQGIVG